ncbi:MAG: hypothetical protein GX130_06525 [Candidatus Hydrogenedens sp.]|jgi:hypothetical protein|nr:hypothetical protein [Candidatus Hydrogenedens sp.]
MNSGMLMKRCSLIFPALLLYAGLSCAAPPEQIFTVRIKTVVEGVGLSARKSAQEKAEQEALAEAIQSLTESPDLSHYQPMLKEAPRYIRQTRILHTETLDQSTELEADIVLLEKPLRHDLATLMLPHLPHKPVVRLLLAESVHEETHDGGPTFDEGEKVLRERLTDFGFDTRGIHDLLDNYDIDFLAEVTAGEREEGASFARSCLEEVIIVGRTLVHQEALNPGSNVLRNRAETTLRVFSGREGKLQDTLYAQAVVQSADAREGALQAVQDSCGKLAGECIVAAILTGKGHLDSEHVMITVENPETEERMERLTDFLENLDPVASATLLFYSPEQTRISIVFPGSMAWLSDTLTGILLQGKKVEVARCVGRELTLRLR